MTAPMTGDPQKARVSRNVDKMAAQGASAHEIETYIQSEGVTPVQPEHEGVFSRAAGKVGDAVSQMVTHPIDTAESLIVSPVKSVLNGLFTPDEGDARGNPNLSKGGNSAHVDPKHWQQPFTAAQGARPAGSRRNDLLSTAALVAFPGIAGGVAGKLGGGMLAKSVGLAAGGGVLGAANDPADPFASGIAGAALAAGLHGAGKLTGKAAGAVGGGLADVGEKILDVKGRPEVSKPLIQAGPFSIGRVASVGERAAELNDKRLGVQLPLPKSGKPLAPVDQSVNAQRLARGLKTSSPAAETVLRDALHPRAEGAVDRVIQHGLETTGLQSRESGLQVVDDLIAERAKHGAENFRPIYDKYPNPIDDPRFDEILKTDAGQQVVRRFKTLASNKRQKIGTIAEVAPAPEGIPPADWANMQRLAKERGMPIPTVEGSSRLTPTVEQAHGIKMAFDDLLTSPPEPGSGGLGPHNIKAIRALKNEWLDVMKEHSPEIGDALKTYATESDLIRAGELGRKLFSMHPDEAAKAFGEMSESERTVARRAGFDALSDRIENGPADVEKGVSKPRDQKRMRLLFPDDASFTAFQEGLKQEAQMHSTTQGVLGGSNTADKLADMAGMAGVTLPDVLHAASGRPMALLRKAGDAMLRKSTSEGGNKLRAEQARQLVAGADGNTDAIIRLEALRRARGRTP